MSYFNILCLNIKSCSMLHFIKLNVRRTRLDSACFGGLKDKCQVFVIGKWKMWKLEKKTQKCKNFIKKYPDLSQTLFVHISGGKQYYWSLSEVKVRVGVAGAGEKGSGSFWPMWSKLWMIKVGVCQFLVLNDKPNFLWLQMEF